ncbi:MAG TPA: protease pro-enzyme activation domain-containing protein [Bryobacteraceae bacterium]|nr:protease pro-enzyme activation domain-containing protein [Bryobacteraceae bacterium]
MLSSRSVRATLFACLSASALTAQTARIPGPVDGRGFVTIRGSVPSQARPETDRGAVAGSFPLGNITLVLKPSPAQQAELDQLLAEQQDPSSPNYHQWLTPEAYADRFGASKADLEKIAGWLESQGFTVKYTARGRDFISFSGTAGQAQSAFQTEIHRFHTEGALHYANATDISLPLAIAPMVAGVLGLHDFHPKAPHKRITPSFTDGGGNNYLVPDDYATIYDLERLYQFGFTGAGQNIAIVGQSDIDPDDIATFRAAFGLAPANLEVVPVGVYPGVTGDEIEADLDLEWAGAVARNANLIYVVSEDADYSAFVAIDNNMAPVISESFGLCEYIVASNRLGLYNYRVEAQKGASMGITWVVSSGDSGAAGCDYDVSVATQGLGVSLPASIPEVTAVGGTEFNEAGLSYWSAVNGPYGGSAISYIPETSWNDTLESGGLAASGGGKSSVYTKPAWQTGPGVPDDGVRDVPDVALDASNQHDPYWVISEGGSFLVGGTSAAAPSFAAMVAVLNQYLVENQVQSAPGLGNINVKLYGMAVGNAPGVFHDVTTGSNIVPCAAKSPDCDNGQFGYSAGTGYDLVTGLGTVDAYNLVTVWSGIPVVDTSMTLAASVPAISPGGSAVITATVTAASGSRTPAGQVQFAMGGTLLGSAALSGSGATATASLTVFGAQFLAASNTISASYSGSPIFTASSAATTLTLGAPATSAVTVSVTPNPVYQHAPGANGATFSFTVQLQETAGVGTTLTGFTFDGMSFAGSMAAFFGTASLAAHGSLTANLNAGNITPPAQVPVVFTGRDASGASWSRQIVVPFLPAQQ